MIDDTPSVRTHCDVNATFWCIATISNWAITCAPSVVRGRTFGDRSFPPVALNYQ